VFVQPLLPSFRLACVCKVKTTTRSRWRRKRKTNKHKQTRTVNGETKRARRLASLTDFFGHSQWVGVKWALSMRRRRRKVSRYCDSDLMGGNRVTVCACVYWCDIKFFRLSVLCLSSFVVFFFSDFYSRSTPCVYGDQIGCFVPASSASFRIVDQMFSRLCTHDRIENNASSFTLEVSLYLSSLSELFSMQLFLLQSSHSSSISPLFIAFLSRSSWQLLVLFLLCLDYV